VHFRRLVEILTVHTGSARRFAEFKNAMDDIHCDGSLKAKRKGSELMKM
jgi:hypothetical protein